jgi:hypothetical protein
MINKYNPKYKREDISKERFDKIKAEVYEKFEKEHTFQPQINYQFSNQMRTNESRDEFYKRLSVPKTVFQNKREKEKSQQEEQKFLEECTFKPQMDKKKEVSEEREQVSTRLFKLAEQLKEKREKLKREQHEAQLNSCTFAPNIDETSKQLMLKYGNTPLYNRVNLSYLV